MDNLKGNEYYLKKIVFSLNLIMERTQGKSKKELKQDSPLFDSVMFRIVQIAEDYNKLTERFKASNREIPWYQIRGMRNKIVHDYGIVDIDLVYDTITHDIPRMYNILKDLI